MQVYSPKLSTNNPWSLLWPKSVKTVWDCRARQLDIIWPLCFAGIKIFNKFTVTQLLLRQCTCLQSDLTSPGFWILSKLVNPLRRYRVDAIKQRKLNRRKYFFEDIDIKLLEVCHFDKKIWLLPISSLTLIRMRCMWHQSVLNKNNFQQLHLFFFWV